MMPFSTGIGIERIGVFGPDLDCWRAGLQVVRRLAWGRTAAALIGRLWMWHSSAKRTRKKKGQRGLRPWPLRCISQFLSVRKDRLLRGRMCCVCQRMSMRTFHRWGGLVFIVDVLPVGW